METQTILNVSYGAILLIIVGFVIVPVFDDDGIELEPTHSCESRELKMYCARTTAMYCRPSNSTTRGSKKCTEGWKLIPEPIIINETVNDPIVINETIEEPIIFNPPKGYSDNIGIDTGSERIVVCDDKKCI